MHRHIDMVIEVDHDRLMANSNYCETCDYDDFNYCFCLFGHREILQIDVWHVRWEHRQ